MASAPPQERLTRSHVANATPGLCAARTFAAPHEYDTGAARRCVSVVVMPCRRTRCGIQQVKIDLPPKEEVQILVKLSQAQHLVYRHLLVNQEQTTLDAIMQEADKHAGAGTSRSASPVPPLTSGLPQGGADVEEGPGKTKTMNDSDYRKLMNLLLQLRCVRRSSGQRGTELRRAHACSQ